MFDRELEPKCLASIYKLFALFFRVVYIFDQLDISVIAAFCNSRSTGRIGTNGSFVKDTFPFLVRILALSILFLAPRGLAPGAKRLDCKTLWRRGLLQDGSKIDIYGIALIERGQHFIFLPVWFVLHPAFFTYNAARQREFFIGTLNFNSCLICNAFFGTKYGQETVADAFIDDFLYRCQLIDIRQMGGGSQSRVSIDLAVIIY